MGHNHASLFEAVATSIPEREAIVFGRRRISFAGLLERSYRFANALLAMGVREPKQRSQLAPWESGQDHVALYLHNGNEYLEATLGANRARAVPFNVNYRYVEEELAHLLNDASAAVIVYHSAFAPTLAAVLPRLARAPRLVQVADDSGNDLVSGATGYETLLESSSPATPPTRPSPEDLYILYTGGTTGLPKGTLWRQADIYDAAIGGFAAVTGLDVTSLETAAATAAATNPTRNMPIPPFMHGAAGWGALGTLLAGGTVVIQPVTTRFDPRSVLRTVDEEAVDGILIVGDPFARPLCEEMETGCYGLGSLKVIVSGGAILSPPVKDRLLAALPEVVIIDAGGSSETGTQMASMSAQGQTGEPGVFAPQTDTCVVDAGRTRLVEAGHSEPGWLARRGAIPLGYLDDPAKTRATFPVIAGERLAIPGDRARLRADGMVELLGRDSVTINSGGEKIFAEEVEQAIASHPGVDDVIVVGRPSPTWGSEVVAVVQLHPGCDPSDGELVEHASRRIARFKLPKSIIRVEEVRRSPAGKADYAWARERAGA